MTDKDKGETIVKTWKGVARYSPFSEYTLQKKYAKEMFAAGVVFKSRLRSSRTLTVWGYPSQIMLYWTKKAKENGMIL